MTDPQPASGTAEATAHPLTDSPPRYEPPRLTDEQVDALARDVVMGHWAGTIYPDRANGTGA